MSEDEVCPTCGKPSTGRCKCPLSDTCCEDGHWWHYHYEGGKMVKYFGEAPHDGTHDPSKCEPALPVSLSVIQDLVEEDERKKQMLNDFAAELAEQVIIILDNKFPKMSLGGLIRKACDRWSDHWLMQPVYHTNINPSEESNKEKEGSIYYRVNVRGKPGYVFEPTPELAMMKALEKWQ